MIPGIVSSQFGAAVGGGSTPPPAFLPDGAVVYMDFVAEEYYAAGAERTLGECLDGTYTRSASGLDIADSSGEEPRFSSLVLGDINNLIGSGYVILVEWYQAAATGIDGPLLILLDTGDDASYAVEQRIEQYSNFHESLVGGNFAGDTPAGSIVAGINRVAALYGKPYAETRTTTYGISCNGSVVTTGGAFGPTRWSRRDELLSEVFAAYGGGFIGHRDIWRIDGVDIRKIVVWPSMELHQLEVASAGTDPVISSAGYDYVEDRLNVAFDGSDGATSATDSSSYAHTLTFSGDAQLDTAQKYSGSASLYLQDTTAGSVVTIPDAAAFHLDFHGLIDVRVRFEDLADQQCIIAQWAGAAGNRNFRLSKLGGSTAVIRFETYDGFANTLNSSSLSWSTGVWYRIVVNAYSYFDTGTFDVQEIYRGIGDGALALVGTAFNNQFMPREGATGNVTIGQDGDGNMQFKGWIDALRIRELRPMETVEPTA